MELKIGVAVKVPVVLSDSSGSGLTGIVYSSVTCYIQRQAGASVQKTMVSGDFTEVDATHFPGVYDLLLSASDVDTAGFLKVSCVAPLALFSFNLYEIVTKQAADLSTEIAATTSGAAAAVWGTAVPGAFGVGTAGKVVGDNINATISGVPAAVLGTAVPGAFSAGTAGKLIGDNLTVATSTLATAANLALAHALILRVDALMENKFVIDTGTKTATLYGPDHVTPIQVWNYFEEDLTTPSIENVCRRDPTLTLPT